jgi:DNA-binding GntR family transcriptional regulator
MTVLRTTHGIKKQRLLQISEEHHAMIRCFEKRDTQGALDVHANHCENAKSSMLLLIPELD